MHPVCLKECQLTLHLDQFSLYCSRLRFRRTVISVNMFLSACMQIIHVYLSPISLSLSLTHTHVCVRVCRPTLQPWPWISACTLGINTYCIICILCLFPSLCTPHVEPYPLCPKGSPLLLSLTWALSTNNANQSNERLTGDTPWPSPLSLSLCLGLGFEF